MALIEATPVLKFLGVIDGTPELQRKRPLDLQTQKLADRYTDTKVPGPTSDFAADVIYHTRATVGGPVPPVSTFRSGCPQESSYLTLSYLITPMSSKTRWQEESSYLMSAFRPGCTATP